MRHCFAFRRIVRNESLVGTMVNSTNPYRENMIIVVATKSERVIRLISYNYATSFEADAGQTYDLMGCKI